MTHTHLADHTHSLRARTQQHGWSHLRTPTDSLLLSSSCLLFPPSDVPSTIFCCFLSFPRRVEVRAAVAMGTFMVQGLKHGVRSSDSTKEPPATAACTVETRVAPSCQTTGWFSSTRRCRTPRTCRSTWFRACGRRSRGWGQRVTPPCTRCSATARSRTVTLQGSDRRPNRSAGTSLMLTRVEPNKERASVTFQGALPRRAGAVLSEGVGGPGGQRLGPVRPAALRHRFRRYRLAAAQLSGLTESSGRPRHVHARPPRRYV